MYFGPQTEKHTTGALTYPPAIVQRTGINKSVAFARGSTHTERAAIMLGNGMHLVSKHFKQKRLTKCKNICEYLYHLSQDNADNDVQTCLPFP